MPRLESTSAAPAEARVRWSPRTTTAERAHVPREDPRCRNEDPTQPNECILKEYKNAKISSTHQDNDHTALNLIKQFTSML